MKKITTLLALCVFSTFGYSQMLTYGPAFGVGASNFRLGDEVSEASYSYQVGGFARAKILFLYVQPEILFQSLRAEDNVVHNRIDVPLNLGWKFLMFDINTGPVFHFPIFAEASDIDILDGYNSSATSWQAGVGVELGPIHVGLRYQGGITNVLDSDLIETRWRQTYVHLEYQF
ncbi:MAG: hypothetical protein HWE14_00955 [Flavobacteriia bacterium]|nr:hypothetical protein [Flavobacteriia bacterium]